jgi:DDE superfamily endonuclease
MPLSHLPAQLSRRLVGLASVLDARSAPRLLLLLVGALFAKGRRTVTSWFRAGGITDAFRPAYNALAAAGRHAPGIAIHLLLSALRPLFRLQSRLVFGIDDTPTPRYGRHVEGVGLHHNPSPGPAGEAFVHGHVWVTLAWLAQHPLWGALALPLSALLYVRQKDIAPLAEAYGWAFRTKLQLAVELLHWLLPWVRDLGLEIWVVADGGYAKKVFLQAARAAGVFVVSRLRKDAALRTVPPPERPKGKRGPAPTYGSGRIDLAKRAGQKRGWQRLRCWQYGAERVKTYKTFLATWRPAGGLIRVVLVREEHGWVAFFCTKPEATAAEVLELAAARGALEQTFKDVKEVWGAGQQQVRNVYASVGAWHLNLWLYTVVEVHSWEAPAEALVDRGASPWDAAPRRPSHADRRRALQREILRAEIQAALAEAADPEVFRPLAERLLNMAA